MKHSPTSTLFLVLLFILTFVCMYSNVESIKVLFCPSPSKGHYNPFITIIKNLMKFNPKDANGNNLYEISMSLAWLENVSKPNEWIPQDFPQGDYQIIDKPRGLDKNLNKSIHVYKYGEWKQDFREMSILGGLNVLAELSIESFNFLMERFENYPNEKPDIIIVDSLDLHYSYFDIFQQLNDKFNNSVRLMTVLTTIGEAMDLEDLPLTHPNSITELFWGAFTDHVFGRFEYLHEYFQWFKLKNWRYSIVSILLNAFTSQIVIPLLRIAFHCLALIKIRPHYKTNYVTRNFSYRIYNSVASQYPVMLMAAPGVLESIRMRSYPKYFDIGFPLSNSLTSQPEFKSIQDWLDLLGKNNERMIFISTGSQFKLSIEMNRNIIRGLSILLKSNRDLNVLMRIEKEQLPVLMKELESNQLDYDSLSGKESNAWTRRLKLSSNFLPQQFILNHEATKLFVTHCGFNSVSEGLFYGKLLVGIPIFADQFLVCNRLQDKDFGDWIYSKWITPQSFAKLIENTLNSQEKAERIQWASTLYKYFSANSGERIHNALDFTFRYFNGHKGFDEGDDGMKLPLDWSTFIFITTALQIGLFLWIFKRFMIAVQHVVELEQAKLKENRF